MSNSKDNLPNRVHIPRARDSFTDQWQHWESIEAPNDRAISETLGKRSTGQLGLNYQDIGNSHRQTRNDMEYRQGGQRKIAPAIYQMKTPSETLDHHSE